MNKFDLPQHIADYIVEEVPEWSTGGPETWFEVRPTKDESARREARLHATSIGDTSKTAVYRLHDEDGLLLYVGMSDQPPKRWVQHASKKPWWPRVAALYLEWCDSRTEAKVVEAEAIRAERPVHNVQHNKKQTVKLGPRSHFTRVTQISERPSHWIDAQ